MPYAMTIEGIVKTTWKITNPGFSFPCIFCGSKSTYITTMVDEGRGTHFCMDCGECFYPEFEESTNDDIDWM